GFGVADLAYEYDVGILADHMAKSGRVGGRVQSDLPLLDDRERIVVYHLYRVLDRDDVGSAGVVDVTDHRSDRRRLAGSRGTGDQHEPSGRIRELAHHRRKP